MSEGQPASTTALDTTDQHKLDGLVEEIDKNHKACEAQLRESVRHARTCGKLLTEAKKILPRGEFEPWVERYCTFRLRTAQVYMRVHANWAIAKAGLDKGELLSLGHVNRLLSVARPESPASEDATAQDAPPVPTPTDSGRSVLRDVKPSPALRTLMKRHRIGVELPTLLKFLVALKFDAKLIANKLNSVS